jgi:hypothetical protein
VKVIVYVEGDSDRGALEALLSPIIDAGQQNKVAIRFLPLHGKGAVLRGSWFKAADDLARDPRDWMFALPDLYPMKEFDRTEYPHRSAADLRRVLHERFASRADKLGLPDDVRRHFRVHCLKHDLEALLLAAPDALKQRLGTHEKLGGKWRLPVEDQNDDKPPKRVVEDLFKHCRRKPPYQETTDARWILQKARLDHVEAACPQCFAPFVRELRAISEGRDPDAPKAPVKQENQVS